MNKKPFVIEITSATHKKGDPYPEHNFEKLIGFSSKSDQICYSNEQIKMNLDKIYTTSNATEAKYFYAVYWEHKFKWQYFDKEYFMTRWEDNTILAKVWFDESAELWYYLVENVKDPRYDEKQQSYFSDDEAKQQAEICVVERLGIEA